MFSFQVYQLLQKASKNRSVGETKCNERSSRSHSVFSLKLTGENKITGETSQGMKLYNKHYYIQ